MHKGHGGWPTAFHCSPLLTSRPTFTFSKHGRRAPSSDSFGISSQVLVIQITLPSVLSGNTLERGPMVWRIRRLPFLHYIHFFWILKLCYWGRSLEQHPCTTPILLCLSAVFMFPCHQAKGRWGKALPTCWRCSVLVKWEVKLCEFVQD